MALPTVFFSQITCNFYQLNDPLGNIPTVPHSTCPTASGSAGTELLVIPGSITCAFPSPSHFQAQTPTIRLERLSTLKLKNKLIYVFFKDFIYLFLERGERRETERETSMCGCLLHTPNWGPGPQPRHVPWLGIEPVTLWLAGQHSIHWATPARAKTILKFLPK